MDDEAVAAGDVGEEACAREQGGDFGAETFVDLQIDVAVGAQEPVEGLPDLAEDPPNRPLDGENLPLDG